ncbi:tRNA (adenosine(37)-N6)-threonylcarbamoyltransferase complex ATPase subunit type 1 TsaE [Clostridia bacterium]|nr:tRNA (adenosine(37)-N6)-threonylcarbamoyltransferase complex ATPase subunit type 1 TsaE [Clostridia bacterium]
MLVNKEMIKIVTHSSKETEEVGKKIGKSLTPPCLIIIDGNLGVGKTCLVRGIVAVLGIKDKVTSPTFSLVNRYDCGCLNVYHFDMYRINGLCELESTGFFDYLEEKAIFLVEWGINVEEFLPEGRIKISIRRIGENEREITIDGDAILNHLTQNCEIDG